MRTETAAWLTTFRTMSYIIFVQPAVLSGVMFDQPTGMDCGAITTATCLAAALASAIMGLYARCPSNRRDTGRLCADHGPRAGGMRWVSWLVAGLLLAYFVFVRSRL